MSTYTYSALDSSGREFSGTIELSTQNDVITRLKEMGLFPLKINEKQKPALRRALGRLSAAIEGGSTFSESLSQHPRIFNRLFVNMVRAGEIGGVLEVVLKRLADFSEKSQKIRGKIRAAMFYPMAVLVVATGILALLILYVIPAFREVFSGMGFKMPAFTMFVLVGSIVIAMFLPLIKLINQMSGGGPSGS